MAFDVEMPAMNSGILYNITMQVEKAVVNDWLSWIQQEHIPGMMGTGCFIKHQLLKLMNEDFDEEQTYALQYFASTIYKFNQFEQNFLAQELKKISDKWNTRVMFFTTTMEIVN